MKPVDGKLTTRYETGLDIPMLYWRFSAPMLSIASGPFGGGIGLRSWVLNATVPMWYARDDPGVHAAELAVGLGLDGPGVGLLTGVDVSERVVTEDAGVGVSATVGLGSPAWAAAPDGHLHRMRPGTINIVGFLPVRLSDAALVNAVATVAEAKAQALWDLGIGATGTASDATCLMCPAEGEPEPYGGPRSVWGARLARAVHTAVTDGGMHWQKRGRAWSESAPLRGADRTPGYDHGGMRLDHAPVTWQS
jgi:adenosylcobinamide amidohydrolase